MEVDQPSSNNCLRRFFNRRRGSRPGGATQASYAFSVFVREALLSTCDPFTEASSHMQWNARPSNMRTRCDSIKILPVLQSTASTAVVKGTTFRCNEAATPPLFILYSRSFLFFLFPPSSSLPVHHLVNPAMQIGKQYCHRAYHHATPSSPFWLSPCPPRYSPSFESASCSS